MNAKTITGLTGKAIVNPILADFELAKKESSYVAYLGIRRETSQLFLQYNNGKCFMFNAVPPETLEAATTTPSIGKFFHSELKGVYDVEEMADNLITIAPPAEDDFDPEEDLEDEDLDFETDEV